MRNTADKIVLLEAIHSGAKELLEKEGFSVELLSHSPEGPELDRVLAGATVLGLRSKTRVRREIFAKHPQIRLVGCFCIGTDQVDLAAANQFGVPVFNAPHSNTRSVAELVMAEIVILSRQLSDRSAKAHLGIWQKSAEGSREVRGKTLGIIGYGHIGSQLSILAESFGLKVVFFDIDKKLPLGNSQRMDSLLELLRTSDFVSLHVPDTQQTKEMIGSHEISVMKKGSYLINASRGSVVVIEALAQALRSSHLAGAAVDVFPEEPASNKEAFKSPLQGLANVVLTPHIGGSTIEAQEAIGLEVAQSFLGYLRAGKTLGAVNFPNLEIPRPLGSAGVRTKSLCRIANVHKNVPGVLGEINSIVSDLGANIQAQALSTDSAIGYLLMDIEDGDPAELLKRVRALETSVRTELLL